MHEPELVENVVPFREGARIMLVGGSGTGKSSFIDKIIKFRNEMFEVPPKSILFCSHQGSEVSHMAKMAKSSADKNKGNLQIRFVKEIPGDEDQFPEFSLLIFDDMLTGSDLDKQAARLEPFFTRRAHHEKLYILVTCQNLFANSHYFRQISTSANYLVLFKTFRMLHQIRHLAQQVLGTGSVQDLVEIYKASTSRGPYSYVLFDWHPLTDDKVRYLTNIFEENGEHCIAYIPKNFQ